jgi:glc operon protein GlcG
MNQRAFVNQLSISFEGSQIMLRAAEQHAAKIGVAMSIAIVDAGAHLLAFSRLEGGRTGNIQLALTKAVSACMRRRTTAEEMQLRPNDVGHAIRMALGAGPDKMTSMNGGIPIVVDGAVVGGIGVSGGKGSDDIAVAQAGIDALGL